MNSLVSRRLAVSSTFWRRLLSTAASSTSSSTSTSSSSSVPRGARFVKQRSRRNVAMFLGLFGFIGAVYAYVIAKVGQEEFSDVDKQGNLRVKIK